MAPMTRNRANPDGSASALMAEHYAQRAGAGLIVTEMTVVSASGIAYLNAPGLYTKAQAESWRPLTSKVHKAGGLIVAQLAHSGRISHPSLLPGQLTPVAPSPIKPAGHVYAPTGPQPYVTPRALSSSEIARIVEEFAASARLALDAGFDGIELHAANGYLLDQFLRDATNRRDDEYGGPAANRFRFLHETVNAVASVWGTGRIGVRISPFNPYNDMADSHPELTFTLLANELSKLGLAYLHVVEPVGGAAPRLTPELRRRFHGPLIANGGFDQASAENALQQGEADAVSFGVSFIANPDLPARFARNVPLSAPDPDTFYLGGARGYIDYPAHLSAA